MASQALLVVLAPTIVAVAADLEASVGAVGQARSITAGTAIAASAAIVWRMRDGKAVHFTNYADTMIWARAMGRE